VKKQLAGREYSQEAVAAANAVEAGGVVGAVTGTGGGNLKGMALGASLALAGTASVAANTNEFYIFSSTEKIKKRYCFTCS